MFMIMIILLLLLLTMVMVSRYAIVTWRYDRKRWQEGQSLRDPFVIADRTAYVSIRPCGCVFLNRYSYSASMRTELNDERVSPASLGEETICCRELDLPT